MAYTIALAGKGGTGKTTIAALIVRLIKEQKHGSVLAIDADPNSNLAEALGLRLEETAGTILDDISAHPEDIPAGMGKDSFIEYRLQTAVIEADGFDVLSMGRPEGPGCYCYVNNALRNVVGKLINDYDYVVIDNEAGLEHLSRRTTRSAEVLLVVSDATIPGLRAAKRIAELVSELKIKINQEFLIVNSHDRQIEEEKIKGLDLAYLGSIPFDEKIREISLNGGSLMALDKNSAALAAMKKLGENIWQHR